MAIIRLHAPIEWGYDTNTGEILIRLREEMPSDGSVDGMTWQATREGIVRLLPVSVVIRDITE
jgi:hypothetical protein